MTDWLIYRGTGEPHDGISHLTHPPPWRAFHGEPPLPGRRDSGVPGHLNDLEIAQTYRPDPDTVELVNAALYLRRPLLITGKPGTGKSSLAHSVAYELGLGPVLRWPITSRSTLQEGLYSYDAIGRLQDLNLRGEDPGTNGTVPDIGDYLHLGPLGTALLPYEVPRVLLIDEIDKSDIDLPNDLLNLFEYPSYPIPQLARVAERTPEVSVLTADGDERVPVRRGQVACRAFPFIVMTSNGERSFPPAFLRRCIRLELREPDATQLAGIVARHLGPELAAEAQDLLDQFMAGRQDGDLAADQLLNAVYLTSHAAREQGTDRTRLARLLMQHLDRLS